LQGSFGASHHDAVQHTVGRGAIDTAIVVGATAAKVTAAYECPITEVEAVVVVDVSRRYRVQKKWADLRVDCLRTNFGRRRRLLVVGWGSPGLAIFLAILQKAVTPEVATNQAVIGLTVLKGQAVVDTSDVGPNIVALPVNGADAVLTALAEFEVGVIFLDVGTAKAFRFAREPSKVRHTKIDNLLRRRHRIVEDQTQLNDRDTTNDLERTAQRPHTAGLFDYALISDLRLKNTKPLIQERNEN